MHRFIPSAAVIFLLCAPALGGETAWQELAPDVRIRLISTGETTADGTTMLGLEIDMPAATKTYWRVPGDTGLPTRLDWTGSAGLADARIQWPYPTRSHTGDYLDYVYYGPTILPIEVAVNGDAPVAQLSAVLGICSDICMPAQAQFTLALDETTPDRANGLRLRQALSETPAAWDGKAEAIGSIELRPDGEAIGVWVADPQIDPTSLIAATPAGEPLFGAPVPGPEPGLVIVPLVGAEAALDLRDREVELTFMTARGAYSVTRIVGSAP